ncbi:MAG: carboxy terminal-processing peptidase [Victivallaceae bacterium]
MKKTVFLRLFIISAVSVFFTIAPQLYGINEKLTEEQRLSIITRLTARLIASNHYRQHPLDNKISSQIFDEYFKLLDPSKIYFTQDDIKSFEKYRYYLDDLTQMGNTDFAFDVYKLYLERLVLYRKYAEEALKKGFDFNQDETFVIDRKNIPRPVNLVELQEVWRKKLKNDLLYFKLMKKSIAESNVKNNDAAQKSIKEVWDKRSPEEKILKRLRDIYNEMSQKEKIDILGFYLTCLAQTYGPHSSYFSPKEEEDFDINMKLSLVGIGAVLSSDDGYTKVISVMPGGPAAKDGRIKADDRIIAVAQENGEPVDIIDMSISKVVNLIRGEKGSKVSLTMLPTSKGANAVPVNITLVRDKVELKNSEANGKIKSIKQPDGSEIKIGIIDLPRFYMDFQAAFKGVPDYKSSTRDVSKIIDDFKKEKVAGVIMDLRSNGGGSLTEAINLTGLFITKGPVVQVRQSDRTVSVKYDPDTTIHYDGPMIVLANKLTSSAAEIFTGAIKDYKRGIIVGDSRTYGKGTVLDVVKLEPLLHSVNQEFPAGTVKFESAVFYRVNGSSTQQLGVIPDIVFPSITEHMDVGELFNDNHLPWDAINEVPHDTYEKNLPQNIETVKKLSAARVKSNQQYKVLKENIDLFDKYKKRTTISLNEGKRWTEYVKEKKVLDDNEKYLEQNNDTFGKKDADDNVDFLLNESVNILTDYIGVQKNAINVELHASRKN